MKLSKFRLILLITIVLIGSCVQQRTCDGCEFSNLSDRDFKHVAVDKGTGTLIQKGDTTSLSKNFRVSDFFISNQDTLTQFYIDCRFIEVAELLHEFTDKFNRFYNLDVKIKITSTVRSHMHNKKVDGAKNSLHLFGKAIDFQFSKANKLLIAMFHLEYIRNAELRQDLELLGISSFIFYNNHIHLAIRGGHYFEDKRHSQFKKMYN